MTRLLIPRYGNGNVAAWAPGITAVNKGGAVPNLGDVEPMSSTISVTGTGMTTAQFLYVNTGLRLVGPRGLDGIVRNPTFWSNDVADGQRRDEVMRADGLPAVLHGGYPVVGMFCIEIDRTMPDTASLRNVAAFLAVQNTGSLYNRSASPIRKQFTKNSNTYELATFAAWSTNTGHAQDTWPASTAFAQITITWVPYEASANEVGANTPTVVTNPFNGVLDASNYAVQIANLLRGGTVYVSMTKSTVGAVQDWIIGDLIESEDFSASVQPHGSVIYGSSSALVIDRPLLSHGSKTATPTQFLALADSAETFGSARLPLGAAFKLNDGGVGTISGKVTVNDVTYPNQRVTCFRLRDNRVVGQTFSAADGSYSFPDLDPAHSYFVVAHDYTRTYNAVVQDNITPVVP